MSKPRRPRRPIDGVLLLDKPQGITSNQALMRVRHLYQADKAGHTGSLDPLATGLLPVCLGEASKFTQYLLDADKVYVTRIRLGVATTTGDAEGDVVAEAAVPVLDAAAIEQVLDRFRGDIDQVPSMFSALKKDGRPLYELARKGIEIERPARRVTIHRLTMLSVEGDEWTLEAHVSKGTYIRSLAEDIGEVLGCGAHLAGLRRTHSGGLDVAHAVTLDRLAELDEAGRDALLRGPDCMLADWPAVCLPMDEAGRFLTGMRRKVQTPDMPAVRVYGPNPSTFLGSAHVTAGELIPDRLLSPIEVQALLVNQKETP